MPSPIGHALSGLALAWTVAPSGIPGVDRRLPLVAAALAALPDIDLLAPQTHRTVTHSAGAVIVVTIIAAVVTRQVTRRGVWTIAAVCGAAYASHLLLDWLGVDHFAPYGIQALWPFSDAWYISGWNIFRQTARQHLFTTPVIVQNIKAVAQEIAILAPIAWAAWLVRVKALARLAPELTRRDHAAQ
jgi:inner membrane protein